MIVITGAYGFIGSCLVSEFNKVGRGREIVVVDDFYKHKKEINLKHKQVREWIHRDIFIDWFKKYGTHVDMVYHLGARTDTAEMDVQLFDKLNVNYSKDIWNICCEHKIPLVYASSAAIFGDGSKGFDDDDNITPMLEPLNPYGQSKLTFDQWAIKQSKKPPMWVGLRFFNVYGPNEYHKGRMASVIYHTYNQIVESDKMNLFRSHKEDYKNGEQKRDFIYVKDIIKLMLQLNDSKIKSGIYNLGTGNARTFQSLATGVFKALNKKVNIKYIDIPKDIRDSYQYYTQAKMDKLCNSFPNFTFTSLEEGIDEYVNEYLSKNMKIY